MAEYDREPVTVKEVNTEFRTIKTQLPVPESLAIFEKLEQSEPRSMRGQPPIVWDRAEGFTVSDLWGNRRIDWSSGVLIANAGLAGEWMKISPPLIISEEALWESISVFEEAVDAVLGCA